MAAYCPIAMPTVGDLWVRLRAAAIRRRAVRRCRSTSVSHNKGSGRSIGRLPSDNIHSIRFRRRILRSCSTQTFCRSYSRRASLVNNARPAGEKNGSIAMAHCWASSAGSSSAPAIAARSGIVPNELPSEPLLPILAAKIYARNAHQNGLNTIANRGCPIGFRLHRRNVAAFNGTPSNDGVFAL